jgi:hypothetical protein
MITLSRRCLAALLACLGLSLPAAATTYSAIDYTDLWGTTSPLENGWGLNLIQQTDVIFATMFVYGPDGTARWYSASNLSSGNGVTWSGPLAQTTGSYFGAPWSGDAAATVVGNMTVSFSGANSGVLSYNVGNVNVTKNISRFSLRANNLTGRYIGGATTRCTNGTYVLIFDQLTVTQNGLSVVLRVIWNTSATVQGTCDFNGTYGAQGRLATISGNYSCTYTNNSPGNVGTFTISNIEASQNGFNGAYSATDQYCTTQSGQFGGVKDVI